MMESLPRVLINSISLYTQGSRLAPISFSWPCFQSIRVELTRECFKSSYHMDLCGNESVWQPCCAKSALSTFMNLANYNMLTDGWPNLHRLLMPPAAIWETFLPKAGKFFTLVTRMSSQTLESRAWSCGTSEAGADACAAMAGLDLSKMNRAQLEKTLKDLENCSLLLWSNTE